MIISRLKCTPKNRFRDRGLDPDLDQGLTICTTTKVSTKHSPFVGAFSTKKSLFKYDTFYSPKQNIDTFSASLRQTPEPTHYN